MTAASVHTPGPPPGTATPRTIVRNAAATAAATLFTYLTNFFLIPVIVHSLGQDVYGGVWAVAGALTLSLGLLDLGTGTAYVAFIAERAAQGDRDGVNTVVASGLGAGALLGSLIMLAAFLGGESLLRLSGVPAERMEDALFVLHAGAGMLFLVNLLAPLSSLLSGFQRADLQSLIAAGAQILGAAGTLVVLHAGFGVRGLILNNLAVAVIGAGAAIAAGRRLFPGLRVRPGFFRKEVTVAILRYGGDLFVSRLADVIVFQTDRILSLRFFGPTAAAAYDVSARLTSAARSAAGLLLGGLTPAFAGVDAREGRERSLALYRRSLRYLALAAAYLFGFVLAAAGDLLGLWLGPEFRPSATLVRILAAGYFVNILTGAAGYFVNILTGAASAMAAGVGATDLYRRTGIIVSIVYLPLAIGGAAAFGPAGIAAGSAVTLGAGGVYFMTAFHRREGIGVAAVAPLLLKPAVAGGAAAVTVLLAAHGPEQASGRAEFLPAVLLGGFLYTAVFVAVSALLRAVSMDEVRQIRSLVLRKGDA